MSRPKIRSASLLKSLLTKGSSRIFKTRPALENWSTREERESLFGFMCLVLRTRMKEVTRKVTTESARLSSQILFSLLPLDETHDAIYTFLLPACNRVAIFHEEDVVVLKEHF